MQPYPDPAPRSFAQWCNDLGISSEGREWPADQVMTYPQFCYLPDTKLRKVAEGALYGTWRQYGDIYGEARTVKEWLEDIGWHIVEPTVEDLNDINIFLGHDEFWEWGNGRIDQNRDEPGRISLFERLQKLFVKK